MMSAAFAHAPLGAIRSGLTGWKPSGIPAATVLRPWSCGQFQLSIHSSLGGYLTPSAKLAKPQTSWRSRRNGSLRSQIGTTRWDFTAVPRDYSWTGTENGSRNLLIVQAVAEWKEFGKPSAHIIAES